MHAHHHRRRGAGLGNAFDHLGGFGQAQPHAADFFGADQAQQPGLAQCIDGGAWKGAVPVSGLRLGRDGVLDDEVELLQI